MNGILAFAVLLAIYAASELIARKSRAVISMVLGIALILLFGFWSGLLPKTIFKDAHVGGTGMLIVGMLLVSLGTTIDFPELKRQWKVAVTAAAGVVLAATLIICLGRFAMDPFLAVAGSPIFAGGNAATLIMLDGAKAKGLAYVGTFCLVLLVTQKFFGIPIASWCLRHLAMRLRDDGDFLVAYHGDDEQVVQESSRKPLSLPPIFARPSVYLAKLALLSALAFYMAKLMHGMIHYLVMCLLIGIIFYALGFLEKGILQKTHADGLILFYVTIVIFSNLADTTPQMVVSVLPPLVATAVLGVLGVALSGAVCSKIFSMPWEMTMALGITCTFGFPTTMMVSQEVSQAMGRSELERRALLNYFLPKMLVAGLITVTITSVVLAGIVVNML